MGLRLHRVRLINWKCYRNQTIKFNLDLYTDRNVWIIFGRNGAGKTSILEAIMWCLYGGEVVSRSTIAEYFNRVAVKENSQVEINVQLAFEKDSQYWHISREARRVVKGINVSAIVEEPQVYIDGEAVSDCREVIDKLLPRSCKDFFFFDGIKIENYAQMTQTQESRIAIEKVLGIPELKNLRDDAKSALQKIEQNLNEVSCANQDLTNITTQLNSLQEEIEIVQGQLQEAKKNYHLAEEIFKDVQARANQIEDLRGKLNEITRLGQEKNRLQESLKSAEEKLETALQRTPISLMLEFVQEMVDDLQRKSMMNNRRSVSVTELKKLLKADTCLCGRCITDEVREYIQQQLQSFDESERLTREALAQDELRNRLMVLSRYHQPDLDELLLERDRIQDNLEEVNQAISRLKQETKSVDQDEANEIWRKLGREEKSVEEKERKIYRLQSDLNNLQQQEDKLSRERESLASRSQETAMLAKQIKLARGLSNAANELIEWYIDECKETIEKETSQMHRYVTNKPEEYIGVQINKDYTLGGKTLTGEVLKPEILSAGEKEALAFAFITGLNLASGTAAPLIMDTPFGHLDIQHQKNIVNALPKIPSQVILLATDRDFPNYLLDELRPHVVETHHIRRGEATEDVSIVEIE